MPAAPSAWSASCRRRNSDRVLAPTSRGICTEDPRQPIRRAGKSARHAADATRAIAPKIDWSDLHAAEAELPRHARVQGLRSCRRSSATSTGRRSSRAGSLSGAIRRSSRTTSSARPRARLLDDTQAMLERMVARSGSRRMRVVGFWPANSDGDDIELYTDETRSAGARAAAHAAPADGARRHKGQPGALRFHRAEEAAGRLYRRLCGHGGHRRGGRGARDSNAPTTTIPRSW